MYIQNIIINNFLFTGRNQPDYLIAAVKNSIESNRLLSLIFEKVIELNRNNIIEGYYTLQAGPLNSISLNSELSLEILSPSTFEETKFLESVNLKTVFNSDIRNTPAANWLSPVLKISTKDWYILLTSDCYKETLVRLDKLGLEKESQVLKIGQVAHHGSQVSHNNTFWKKRQKNMKEIVVFSVGENSYGLPSHEVVHFFRDYGFIIHSTNPVGSIGAFGQPKGDLLLKSHLRVFAPLVSVGSDQYSGNQKFSMIFFKEFFPTLMVLIYLQKQKN